MAHRFRFIGERVADGTWRLVGDEAHHVAKVLRLAEGTAVEVTDGRGAEAEGTLASIKASEVVIAVEAERRVDGPAAPFVFAVGALKPGAVDDILPALTELGVDEVWVFQQQESAKSRLAERATQRWYRIVAQSVKQCKRAWIPELRTFESLAALIEEGEARGLGAKIVLAAHTERSLTTLATETAHQAVIVIAGGEKGLAPEEERALEGAGYLAATLGPYVLRAVTAAVAAAAVVTALRRRGPR